MTVFSSRELMGDWRLEKWEVLRVGFRNQHISPSKLDSKLIAMF